MIMKNYDVIELLTNKYSSQWAEIWDIGVIIEIFNNWEAFEIAFTDPETWEDFAQIAAHKEDIKIVSEHNIKKNRGKIRERDVLK